MNSFKQLLDEVLGISRIIKVKVSKGYLRLITLTSTLIIVDITKTESNNCFIIHWTKRKMEVMFLLLHWQETTQSSRTWHDYPWPNLVPRSLVDEAEGEIWPNPICITWSPVRNVIGEASAYAQHKFGAVKADFVAYNKLGRARTVYKGLYNWPNETTGKQHKQCP